MLTFGSWLLIIASGAAIFELVRHRTTDPRPLWLALAAPAIAMVAFMWFVSEPGHLFADFHEAYYFAGQRIRDNPDSLYDKFDPTAGFTNIPIVAWLFVPLTAVNSDTAALVMLAIGVAAIVAACALTISLTRSTGLQAYAIVALFVINGPLYNSLREGNTTHIILLALVAALWCAEKHRDIALGVLLALAAIIKPPLVLLLVPFLARRRWGVAAGFAASAIPIIGLSVAIYGIGLHREWYETTVEPFSRHPLGAFNVQSLDAFIARLSTGREHLYSWEPITTFGTEFRIARTIVIGAMLAGALVVCWRWRVDSPSRGSTAGITRDETERRMEAQAIDLQVEFCVALVIALIVTPTSWSHYYLMLLIPTSLLITRRITFPDTGPWRVALAACIALISAPVTALNPDRILIGELNSHLITSHFVVGGVLLLAFLLGVRYRTGIVPARTTARGAASLASRSLLRAHR